MSLITRGTCSSADVEYNARVLWLHYLAGARAAARGAAAADNPHRGKPLYAECAIAWDAGYVWRSRALELEGRGR